MKLTSLMGAGLVALLLLAGCGKAEAPTTPPAPTAPVVEKTKPAASPVARPKPKKAPKVRKAAPAKPPKAVKRARIKAPADPDAARRDCTGDAVRLCASSIPFGREAITKCMVANRRSVSKTCQAHFA